jgi:hypothetical protein
MEEEGKLIGWKKVTPSTEDEYSETETKNHRRGNKRNSRVS